MLQANVRKSENNVIMTVTLVKTQIWVPDIIPSTNIVYSIKTFIYMIGHH